MIQYLSLIPATYQIVNFHGTIFGTVLESVCNDRVALIAAKVTTLLEHDGVYS